MDLKYVTPASHGKYYPDHLQVLGTWCVCNADQKKISWVLCNVENWNVIFPGAPPCSPQPFEFASSDYVRMELDMEIFEMLQETHGGWNPAMSNVGVESVVPLRA